MSVCLRRPCARVQKMIELCRKGERTIVSPRRRGRVRKKSDSPIIARLNRDSAPLPPRVRSPLRSAATPHPVAGIFQGQNPSLLMPAYGELAIGLALASGIWPPERHASSKKPVLFHFWNSNLIGNLRRHVFTQVHTRGRASQTG